MTTPTKPAVAPYLRLRQICLVARDLERAVDDIHHVLGVDVCYRDPNVAKYGLVNALFPIGHAFLEVVSPVREDTAAGRFLDRNHDRHGYMVILDCDDVDARRDHLLGLGVRLATELRYEDYHGIQLHPKDTGAALIEFNHTEHGQSLDGPYHPAGPHWQRFVRNDVSTALLAAEVCGRGIGPLAATWSALMQRPVIDEVMTLDQGRIEFRENAVHAPALTGIVVAAGDPSAISARARERGCVDTDGTVLLAGVRVHLVPAHAGATS